VDGRDKPGHDGEKSKIYYFLFLEIWLDRVKASEYTKYHPVSLRGALRNVTKREAECGGRGCAIDEQR
jgi:hypothetical protein